MRKLKTGIDNYSLYPLDLSPMETLKWALKHGAEGVAFSGLDKKNQSIAGRSYLLEMLAFARENRMYIEWGGGQHIPRDLTNWSKKDLFELNRKAAEDAMSLETRIIRSCSGGLMRWDPTSPSTETLLNEIALCLKAQKQMLRDFNVLLAIETHFEFTTFELLRLFEKCDAEPGDYLGICLDTMNLLTMLEDPETAVERILPWVVSCHIKDGGILQTRNGFNSFPTGIGDGVINFNEIISMIGSLPQEVFLSIEDHGGNFDIPINNKEFKKEFPDFTEEEQNKLVQLSNATRQKIKKGKCRKTSREEWPELCETRIIEDIVNLKRIVDELKIEN